MEEEDLFYASRSLFPIEEEKSIFEYLITKWKKTRDSILIYISDISRADEYPFVVGMGVTGIDWAGLGDTTMGVLHQYGWNLYYIKGEVVNVLEYTIATLIIGIKIETSAQYNQ